MEKRRPRGPRKVLIAGSGFAAVEALLALRTLLGDAVQLTLVSAGKELAFRPAATYEAFGGEVEPASAYSLGEIAADADARFVHDRLEAVAPAVHTVRLASGSSLGYDSLILALGARARVAIPGALTFRDQHEVPRMRALLEELRRGSVRRIVFAVPSGCAWSLPLYELALLSASYADSNSAETEISVVTPASAPLEVFGRQASALVREQLLERGVRFRGGLVPASVRRDGALRLHFGGSVPADRVVAVPQLRGPRIAGVPSRWWGFVPVDAEGRVESLSDVYAAGDMTSFPIKQGGLAAQQADLIARVIAATDGVDVSIPPPVDPGRIIEARLVDGTDALVLRARLDSRGTHDASGGAAVAPMRRPGPMRERVDARYLGAYLADRRAAARRAQRVRNDAAEDAHASNGV